MIKIFKIFEIVQINKMNEVEVYYTDIDRYKIIFIVKNGEIVGFVNEGFQTKIMEEKNIHNIGTIWGPGYGDLIYSLAISKFGPIVPSSNVSDRAKESHKRRIKNNNFLKYKIKGIGSYGKSWVGDESYLNTIFDLDPETKQFLRAKIADCDDKDLISKLKTIFFSIKDDYDRNHHKYYTSGKSRYKAGYTKAEADELFKSYQSP